MHYNDEARRFNLLSGFACGTVIGAGLALLLALQNRVRVPLLATRRAPSWKTRAAKGMRRLAR